MGTLQFDALEFDALGEPEIRFWLYIRDTNSRYNWTNGTFDGKNSQSSRIEADVHGIVRLPIAGLGLADGDYECRVTGSTYCEETAKARRIYFFLTTGADGVQRVGKAGEWSPPAATQVGGIKSMVTETLDLMPDISLSLAAAQRPAQPPSWTAGLQATLGGRTQAVSAWAAEKGLNPRDVYARLAQGCTLEEALDAPARNSQHAAPDRAGRAIELE